MSARTIQRSSCDRASRSDFDIFGITAAGYSRRVIEIVACVSRYRCENLRATCHRSRVRHDRFSHAARPSRAACARSRAFPPMSNVCDANEFRSASATDARQSISTALLGIWRAFAVVFFSLCALVENAIAIPFFSGARRLHARALWLHRWSRFACRVLGIRIRTHGSMPSSGLLVSNHLSYLDIVVLSSIRPCVFVAKRDVARWPLFGWLAHAAGTIFVDRERRFSSRKAVEVVRQAIGTGSVVVLFPEGTSSDG